MDEHGLPLVGAGVDYQKVPPLDHRNTLVMLNTFLVHTAKLLNRFSSVCEERLSELSIRIQRLNISMRILEEKLASIPGLDDVQAAQYEPPSGMAAAGSIAHGSSSQPPPTTTTAAPPPLPGAVSDGTEPLPPPQPTVEEKQVTKIKDDPRFQQFFKMKRLGVNPLQIAMEMKKKGYDPDLLDDENAPAPPGGAGGVADASYNAGRDSSDSDDTTSSDETDDSYDSDD